MHRHMMTAVILFLCSSPISRGQQEDSALSSRGNDRVLTIVALSGPRVDGRVCEWRYQIRNESAQDIWICGNMGIPCEMHMASDGETLIMQRRLDLRPEGLLEAPPGAQYVRLRPGETRTELMSLSLPVTPVHMFSLPAIPAPVEEVKHLSRMVLEIGYYTDDLPATILDVIHEAERDPDKQGHGPTPWEYHPASFFGGTTRGFLRFNNEGRASKSEWVYLPYMWQTLKGEQVLELTAEGLRIPFTERGHDLGPPTVRGTTRMEMEFKTGALEFFFPYTWEQNLLDSNEKQYLQSLRTVTIKDRRLLATLADEVAEGGRDAFAWENGVADVRCYSGDERLTSFRIYNGLEIVRSQGQVFWFLHPGKLSGLRKITRHVESLDDRVQCAANLHDLWYRLRLYHRAKADAASGSPAESHESYPLAADWCDALSTAYWSLGSELYRCPSVSWGKCHYAMNPGCSCDSPGNVVFLFETKRGWNQHGGPELFTFNHHEPKGGLVLLNDGTVKFIRTKAELKQLRWK